MNVLGTPEEFIDWLDKAKKGAKAIYYDGFLFRDKEMHKATNGTLVQYPKNILTAISAWNAYLGGRVILAQKKLENSYYKYIAVKI